MARAVLLMSRHKELRVLPRDDDARDALATAIRKTAREIHATALSAYLQKFAGFPRD